MKTKREGWSWLLNSRKGHYVVFVPDGRALCQRWAILGSGDFAEPTHLERCAMCERERVKRNLSGQRESR